MVDDDLGDRADAARDDGELGEHRLEQREAEALPAGRMDEQLGAQQPVGDVTHAAGQVHRVGNAALGGEAEQLLLQAAAPEHDENRLRVAGADQGQSLDRHVDPLLTLEA